MAEELTQEEYLEKTNLIIESYGSEEGELIQILLDIQEKFRWIPKVAINQISEKLKIPKSRIFRVGSFYKGMNLEPMGDHLVQVCLGTACSVRGAERVYEKAQALLDLEEEGTTEDRKFTLRRVNCLGCCAMGPVMVVDGDYYGKISVGEVEEALENYG